MHNALDPNHQLHFRTQLQGLHPKHDIDHHIDLIPGTTLISIHSYKLSWTEDDEIASQFKEYSRMGRIYIIVPILVKKKDGAWRQCINYHCLNNITIGNSYPWPRANDLIDHLQAWENTFQRLIWKLVITILELLKMIFQKQHFMCVMAIMSF